MLNYSTRKICKSLQLFSGTNSAKISTQYKKMLSNAFVTKPTDKMEHLLDYLMTLKLSLVKVLL